MLILALRTDNPTAEIGLFEDKSKLSHASWQAGRDLSITLHQKIEDILELNNKAWQDIEGVVVYKGPGSFTGLRIGFSVANTVAYTLQIPIVSELSGEWELLGISRLLKGENEKVALPEYGSAPKTTKPKK